jgi:hypothetical protein
MEHRDDEPNELPDWRWIFDPTTERDPAEFDPEAQWAATGRGMKEWRAGHALRMWRGHARAFATPPFDAKRDAYERAAAYGLAKLRAVGTFDELIAHYFDQRHRGNVVDAAFRNGLPVDPASGTVERWVADAIAWSGDPRLVPDLVEELAFWRRAQELVLLAAAG